MSYIERFQHLVKIVQQDRSLFEKSIKAADILLTSKLDSFRSSMISHKFVYGEILTQLSRPSCAQAFLSGTDGALTLKQAEIDFLQRLKSAWYPSFRECSSLKLVEAKAAEASRVVAAVLSASEAVVDKELNLKGS
ncbi:hypothetical protein COOONC_25370 [Cooperia oncophora]